MNAFADHPYAFRKLDPGGINTQCSPAEEELYKVIAQAVIEKLEDIPELEREPVPENLFQDFS